MHKVVHLVPYDGIGGVETAARSLVDGNYDGIMFSKVFLLEKFQKSSRNFRQSENNPFVYLKTIKKLLEIKPDIIITSLWRSCITAVLVKLLRPKTKIITFLHYPKDTHIFDLLANRLSMLLSTEIWADSSATLSRIPEYNRVLIRVISFLVERLSAPSTVTLRPVFVFWGRLNFQKGLSRALKIFARIYGEDKQSMFHIIGPDGGQKAVLENLVCSLNLLGRVHFHGAMEQDDIFQFSCSCSFYLQTSEMEGGALSAIEAMQLGLVPIVTPVGEIKNYARNSENAIVVTDDEAAVQSVIGLLKSHDRFLSLRKKTIETWLNQPLYSQTVLAALISLVGERQEIGK